MRLIDADELLTAFPVDDEPMLTKSCVRMTIQHMHTIEPEIIRCKDCKFSIDDPISDGRYWCHIHRAYMHYCSEAERKDNG